MVTVWDRRNKKWVNIPQSWVDSPDFDALFVRKDDMEVEEAKAIVEADSTPEPEETPAAKSKPVRANTRKKEASDA